MDMQTQLFEAALGIEIPIFIDRIEFNKDNGELHIHMDFSRGGKFSCPVCSKNGCDVHDTTEKIWRHLNFFQYKCLIHFRTPSTKCDTCGVHLFVPSWGREQSGFTLLFEAFILTLARAMPISVIAAMVGETDGRISRIIQAHVNKAYLEKDLSEVTAIGVDETSSRKGHKYVSIFVNMKEKDIIFATVGKDAETISRFAEELPKHNGNVANIKEVSMDMSPAFISGVANKFPEASVTFDKFHVIKQLNEAIDEVRRNEQKHSPLLKCSRYIWLKNPENLTTEQATSLQTLSKENKRLAKAYQMKLTFQDIYRLICCRAAEAAMKKWLCWAFRSRLEPIKKFAQMLKRHYEGVLRYFDSRLTAGISEGINSRIQEVKRRAKGYRNMNNFITMIYLEGSKLTLPAF